MALTFTQAWDTKDADVMRLLVQLVEGTNRYVARTPGIVLAGLVFSFGSSGFSQDGLVVRNLGARSVVVGGDWLVYSVYESFRNQDLNEDGDTSDEVIQVERLSTGETENLQHVFGDKVLLGDRLLVTVLESWRGEDLNGDGDTDDRVFYLHDLSTGRVRILCASGTTWGWSDRWLLQGLPEKPDGTDLNGDGDAVDHSVIHVTNLASGVTTNLGIQGGPLETYYGFVGDRFVFRASESENNKDLNGDGDSEDIVVLVHDLSTGETTDSGLEVGYYGFFGDWLVFWTSEHQNDTDLNGDGDAADAQVIHMKNLATGEIRNLGFDGLFHLQGSLIVSDNRVLILVRESSQNEADLNGDGDVSDLVFHAYDLATGESVNTGITANSLENCMGCEVPVFDRDLLFWSVYEEAQGEDLNGDGDARDRISVVHDLSTGETRSLGLFGSFRFVFGSRVFFKVFEGNEEDVLYVHELATGQTRSLGIQGHIQRYGGFLVFPKYESDEEDLNADGDAVDSVVHVRDLHREQTTNLQLASGNFYVHGNWLVVYVSEDGQGRDLNGDGDLVDFVAHVADLNALTLAFRRGDCNADGTVDIADPVSSLDFQFVGNFDPPCRDALDFDDNGIIDVSDPIANLTYQFVGGPPPALPGKDTCGVDPTEDEFTCEGFAVCRAGE